MKTQKILWKEIQIDDTFVDGSKVTSIHDEYEENCYKIWYKKRPIFYWKSMVLSETHLLLCDISKLNDTFKEWVQDNFKDFFIPTCYDKHVYLEEDENGSIKNKIETIQLIDGDKSNIDENLYWLPVKTIAYLIFNQQKVICNGNEIFDIIFYNKRKVFCVETDSHKFEANGLIHHNSVTLRNIIFHCLTHQEEISIALIDLKYTEFTPFKGLKNVVAVANTVQEAAEIMRIAKQCMYKRNQELAKLGINDIKDFKPQKPTNEVVVAGRKLKDDTVIEVKIGNDVKTLTVKELESLF